MIQRMSAIFLSTLILAGGAWLASRVPAVDAKEAHSRPPGLTDTVEGVRNSRGNVILLVMETPDTFENVDYENAVGYEEIPASTGTVRAQFPNLNSGPYAVIAFHDENENRDLDMNGIFPVEGYSVSGAKDAYDEPSFDRAASDEPERAVRLFYLEKER